ncbi:hypothetical protein [Christiangramia salexigens]|nr:hypothetical protein [Christiangramia salexigens]
MKKIFILLALTFTTSIVMTSCREESKTEKAVEKVEDVADDIEDEMD